MEVGCVRHLADAFSLSGPLGADREVKCHNSKMSQTSNASHPTVSRNHADRMVLWVHSSQEFGLLADALIMLAIQQLGHAEGPLLAMEDNLVAYQSVEPMDPIYRGIRLMECSALSRYWVFGLYEMLRTSRDLSATNFEPVQSFFKKVEIARMPLAKHEVKGAPGYRNVSHFPTGLWSPETGQVGWHAFDPYKQEMVVVTRTALADEFLKLTGFEKRPLSGVPAGHEQQ
jgi:hypothetical protein